MPDFRPPPDWRQPAHRHTPLIDPVITVRQLSRFGFARRALTRIDHALVFSTARGGYDAYLPPLRPSRREVAAKRCTAVYEVDMGVHPYRAEIPLPSDDDAFEFIATVDLSWRVADPVAFVGSGHRNVPALLLDELRRAARPLTRRFAVHDSASAEHEVLHVLSGRIPPGRTAGLNVTWTLRLRRDQQDIDHRRRLQSIDHHAAEQLRTEQLAAELRKLEAEKIEFYQRYLEQGGVVAWAMHLAGNPQDSRLVVDRMREDRLRLVLAEVELARELLSGDSAEDYELEGPKRRALDFMYEIFNQHVEGLTREQSTPEPPPVPAPREVGDERADLTP
ncbi:hypothetical protein [Streptomyces sp. Je 1-369]|uniref:hypothetical protein n=1 Tax=Streptomyces sp. Je 1-369 TaxID=2966192 RepID=UPI00228674EA|nr:hypothetical protein [Streptomyces sp. Je 1-369]WAL97300.1 hypothetical protein NOO62_24090 [Streptomyces sp. Je 1-369]